MRQALDRRALSALAAGHLAVDLANGALPGLLPFLKDRFNLTYTLAGVLMLASTTCSSLIQPLFGHWSDRRGAVWLLPAGVAVSGVGIALAADAPTYWLVLLLVIVSGLGVAAYHPEGSKFAAFASGDKRASGMSFFSLGGNVGYALGPLIATPLVLWQGLRGGLLLALPGIAIAVLLVRASPFLQTFATAERHPAREGGRDRPGALAILLGVICFRSIAWFGLVTFVPLWEVSLGHSKAQGSHLLSLMLLAGVAGTIVAGPLADRIGLRPVLLGSLLASCPLMLVFVLVGGIPGAVALALTGCCVIGTFGVTMVLSQQYLPSRIGTASGLSIGLSIGLGGVAAVGLGAVADSVDLQAALLVSAFAPLAALALAVLLPGTGRAAEPDELVAVAMR